MDQIDLVRADMDRAASSTRTAAESARDASGHEHISAAASGIPGSTSGPLLTGMAPEWDAEVRAWGDAAADFSDSVAETTAGVGAADGAAAGISGTLASAVGRGEG